MWAKLTHAHWCPAVVLIPLPSSQRVTVAPTLHFWCLRSLGSLKARERVGMAACNFSGLRGISHRVCIIGLSVLLLVQLLVSLTVPRAYSSASDDEPAFLVISIEKNDGGSLTSEDRKNERDLESGVLGLWTDEDSSLTGYEDENELEGPQVISYSQVQLLSSSLRAEILIHCNINIHWNIIILKLT